MKKLIILLYSILAIFVAINYIHWDGLSQLAMVKGINIIFSVGSCIYIFLNMYNSGQEKVIELPFNIAIKFVTIIFVFINIVIFILANSFSWSTIFLITIIITIIYTTILQSIFSFGKKVK